jgi:hypothetical protein
VKKAVVYHDPMSNTVHVREDDCCADLAALRAEVRDWFTEQDLRWQVSPQDFPAIAAALEEEG